MDATKLIEQIDSAMAMLTAVRLALASSRPKIAETIAAEEAAGICHYCKEPLGDEKPIRGCHQRCNQRIARSRKSGEISEEELLEAGLIGPPKQAGRKRKMSVREMLDSHASATARADADRSRAQAKRQRKGGSSS